MFTPHRYDDDAVRRAFREHGPYVKRWSIPDEDLEAYLSAEYNNSDDSESAESVDDRTMDAPLAVRDRTTFGTFDCNENPRQQLTQRHHHMLQQPQLGRRHLSISNLVGPKCAGIVCIVLGLALLGTIYLGFPVLKGLLFPG
jgi:hypothetical protein